MLRNNTDLDSKSSNDETKIQNYLHYVNDINPDQLIDNLFKQISNTATVFYLVDIFDLETTINKRVLSIIAQKKIDLVFIINKYDVLPKEIIEDRMKVWIGENLKPICAKIPNLSYTYILASSKNGHNFDYLLYKIKKIKESSTTKEKPRVYVIGNTNVGKSTFINQLIYRSDKYHKNSPNLKFSHNSIAENIGLLTEMSLKKSELTTSMLAGTTVGVTKIDDVHLGVRVSN